MGTFCSFAQHHTNKDFNYQMGIVEINKMEMKQTGIPRWIKNIHNCYFLKRTKKSSMILDPNITQFFKHGTWVAKIYLSR